MSSPFPEMSCKLVREPFHGPKLLASVWGQSWGLEKEGVRMIPLEGPADAWPEAMFTRDLGM